MTAYLYDQSERKIASLRREAEASGLSQAKTHRGAGQQSFAADPGHELTAGDTLVIEEVGCLGENYEEIVDTIRSLMRRKVRVRSLRDNITFDGAISDAGQQASRDTLISYIAAAAEAKKTAKRAVELPQTRIGIESVARDRGAIQLGVIATQLGALSLAVFLLSFVFPTPAAKKTSELESPGAQVQQESGLKTGQESASKAQQESRPAVEQESGLKTAGAPPQSPPRHELAEFSHVAKNQPNPPNQELAGRLEQPAPLKEPDDPTETNPLALTQEQAQRVHRTVSDWRSARVRHSNVQAEIGAVVPRSVHLARFPRRLVAQLPQLRGKKFIVVDNRIAVVDSPTRQLITFIDQ